jgi:RNA polymerase sigma factor (TIGR02999 family)
MERPGEITILLQKWREGDKRALDQLMPVVYPRLRAIAGSIVRRESEGITLQATDLVNESYLRLKRQRKIGLNDRAHFFSFAAQVMRMILADHWRSNQSKKRKADAPHLPLHDEIPWVNLNSPEIVDLNQALDELETLDSRKVRAVELCYFLGCTATEASELMKVSKATVDRDLQLARAWLFRRLRGQPVGDSSAVE